MTFRLSNQKISGLLRRIKFGAAILAAACLPAAAPCTAQIAWTWEIVSVVVDSGSPMPTDLTLGIRTDSPAQEGRLGNHNVRGSFSQDLFDFNEGHDPSVLSLPLSGYLMTLTDGPGPFSFQVNASYDGEEGEGAEVDTAALSTVVLRFFVRTPDGRSTFDLDPLSQTFWDDNAFRIPVSYDTTGGDVLLRPPDTRVRSSSRQPVRLDLEPGFPNPFNPEISFRYWIPDADPVALEVFDVRGQRIRTLLEGRLEPGVYDIAWDGRDEAGRPAPSGTYLVRLAAGRVCRIQRAVLLR